MEFSGILIADVGRPAHFPFSFSCYGIFIAIVLNMVEIKWMKVKQGECMNFNMVRILFINM
jgi:hypothetical protein